MLIERKTPTRTPRTIITITITITSAITITARIISSAVIVISMIITIIPTIASTRAYSCRRLTLCITTSTTSCSGILWWLNGLNAITISIWLIISEVL